MKINFHHPNTLSSSPFNDFHPGVMKYYPSGPGIYIYGLRKSIDGEKKFLPLYVGIAKDLKFRLWQHFSEEMSLGNSKWYVFNYPTVSTSKDVIDLYADMKQADSEKGLKTSRYSAKMIWFNHSSFFNEKLNIQTGSLYKSNKGVQSSIFDGGDLDNIDNFSPSSGAKTLKEDIIKSKGLFDDDFYFVYASLNNDIDFTDEDQLALIYNEYIKSGKYLEGKKNGPGKALCERAENAIKFALYDQLKIYTCAKSHGLLSKVEIDLSDIQDCLIKLIDHQYNSLDGSYIKPLIVRY